MRENIIIGDLHSCRDEFNQLLDKINYDQSKHRVIIVGDLIDRGDDPVGLVRQIRKMELECVVGNHESKMLRWLKYETRRKEDGTPNPMIPPTDKRRKEWESFSNKSINWLSNLPHQIHIKDNWYVIHAGLEPAVAFEKQKPEHMIRLRRVDKEGFAIRGKSQIANSYFWASRWNQPYNIIFGHERHNEPTKYVNDNNICVAIDQGCVFGGYLTAYNLDRDEFIQVKARKTYYP